MTKFRLTSAALLLIGVAACMSHSSGTPASKPRAIDADLTHWSSYVFSANAVTVTLKVPPGFRIFKTNRLPEATYDQWSQRLLLDAQYDFGRSSSADLPGFEIKARFVRLAVPLSPAPLDATALYRALSAASGQQGRGDDGRPTREQSGAREWMRVTSHGSDAFYTMLDSTTVFSVAGYYSADTQANPQWLESRRQLLRTVVDNVSIAHTAQP
jgi:hypothetical protein